MTLASLGSITKSTIYGLGFYQSFRYSRSLAVGWKEQTGLCALDHVQNLAMMVIAGYANIEALKGTGFANRVWYWSYSTYAVIPAMYLAVNHLADLEKAEETYKKLSELYPPENAADGRSLGQRIQEQFYEDGVPKTYNDKFPKLGPDDPRSLEERIREGLARMHYEEHWELLDRYGIWDLDKLPEKMARDESGGSGILKEIVRLFPRNNREDQRSLGERIEAALEVHQMTDLQKTMKSALDFAFVHVSDFVLIASVVHTVAAIYIGFNRVSNLLQLFFYTWAVAEQGGFITQPEEDRGPLMSLCDGDIVRAYDPTVSMLTDYLAIPFQFLYKGIVGKLMAILTAFIRYSPDEWKLALIPDRVKDGYKEVIKEVEKGQSKWMKILPEVTPDKENHVYGKHNIPFKCLSRLKYFPDSYFNVRNENLEALQIKLIHLINTSISTDEEKARFKAVVVSIHSDDTIRETQKKEAFVVLADYWVNDPAKAQEWMNRNQGSSSELYNLIRDWSRPVEDYLTLFREYHYKLVPSEDQKLAATEKMFEVFKLEDHFSDHSLSDLEQKLQAELEKLAEGSDRKTLEHLIGKTGDRGYLHQHVIACRTQSEKEEKELYLKNIFGWVLQDWDVRKQVLIERNGDFLCRTATGGALQQLAFEIYGDLLAKQAEGIVREAHDVRKDLVEMGIKLILQQRRDLIAMSNMQGGAYAMLKFEDILEAGREQAAENGAQEGIRDQAVGRLQDGVFHFFKEVVMGIGTSRHTNNFGMVLVGKNLGLSNYAEARRDVTIQMHRRFMDISLLDSMANLITPLSDLEFNMQILYGHPGDSETKAALDELIDVIIMKEDKRLNFLVLQQHIEDKFRLNDEAVIDLLNALRADPDKCQEIANVIRDQSARVAAYFENFGDKDPFTKENYRHFPYLDQLMEACDLLGDQKELVEKHNNYLRVYADVEALNEPDSTLFDKRFGEKEAIRNQACAEELGEAYRERARAFLYKYLPQVMYDLGFLAERT